MRVIVDIALKEPNLKLDYRPALVSMLKTAMSAYESGQFFEQYFAEGIHKNYAGAVLLPKPRFERNGIYLEHPRIKLLLSSSDLQTVFDFLNALRAIKDQSIPMNRDNSLTVVRVSTADEPMIQGNLAEFKLLSPLCLRLHQREGNKDRYVSVDAPDFAEVLRESIYGQMRDYDAQLATYVEDLRFNTSACKKTVVWVYGQAIEVTVGRLGLLGNPALLHALLVNGVGSRKPSFFGMLDFIGQEVWQ